MGGFELHGARLCRFVFFFFFMVLFCEALRVKVGVRTVWEWGVGGGSVHWRS